VKQYAAGENKGREGSVVFRPREGRKTPEMPRNRYSEEQITRVLAQMDAALTDWGWSDREDIIRLFLGSPDDRTANGLRRIEQTLHRHICISAS
jgi:DNA helicase-2/ATP-dependent DNA helicase PcrA